MPPAHTIGPDPGLTLTIHLAAETQQRLQARAAANGKEVAVYVQELIEREVAPGAKSDEALAPFRRQVQESGMSDAELHTFFEEVREEVWQEKQSQKP